MSSAASTRPPATRAIDTGRSAGSCRGVRRVSPGSAGQACSSSARIPSSNATGNSSWAWTRIAGSRATAAGYRGGSIGGPCARLASTPSTSAASTTPRASGARRRARSTGTCRRSACSTATRARSPAGSPTAQLNTCHNALDRHVDGGRGDQPALIYDSPVTGHAAHASPTASCATRSPASPGALRGLGVGRGDRVVLYMPMVPEAVIGDAGLRAARRDPLGRVRRLRARTSSPCASTTPGRAVVLSASCGIEGDARRRLQAAARRGARRGRATRPSTA